VADLLNQLSTALADRYRLDRELGRGGMATVFLATDLRHKRSVALKVLHPELAQTLGPGRFQREIETAAGLQHPHILSVHDSGETAGHLWFTMPFIEGESLRDRLNREKQLPVEDAVRITREAAEALDYAHRHGVIHRDIKPENILLSEGHALVADFGIARSLSAGEERLTETGLSVGTPTYMSPEQAAGDWHLDARTDVYSLGTVLYEMLAGEPPFTGATAQTVIAKRFSGEVPRVRHVRPSVPESVEQAVTRALAPVAADRFASAVEFARALQPSTATPSATPTRRSAAAAARGPRRLSVAAMALGVGLVIGLGVLFAWRRSLAGARETGGAKVLAVLPFENLGDSADIYFADGVANDVRTKLSQVAGIEVIARTSSNEYRETRKPAHQIARELGVDYLLTATVQWEKRPGVASRVRVTPELVEVSPGQAPRTRWGQTFDASITDVFQVQAAMASQVASALDVALADSTRRQLAKRPTRNLDAYDAYLRGKEVSAGDITPTALRTAEAEFQRAVRLDSTFASAWAELAMNHVVLFRLGGTQAKDAEAARREVERAIALAPDLPEVRAAKGLYESVIRGDTESALREYQAGLRSAPNRSDLLSLAAGVEARRGGLKEALSHYERAARLDPRSPDLAATLADVYLDLRRFDESQAALTRARALRPSSMSLLYDQAFLDVARGDLEGARQALREAERVTDSTTVVAYVALREDLLWLLDDAGQRLLLTLTPAALDSGRADWALAFAQTYWRRGDEQRARAYADTASKAYGELLRHVFNPLSRAQLMALQALALAYSGREQDALRRGSEALSASKLAAAPPRRLSYVRYLVVRIHLLGGDTEKALDQLEQANYPAGWLKIDPTFAPLRGHPRFERLVKGT
jgi:TolB-like protein/tRNA A-37 threonylcarbamoyl transferase component Bud32